MGLSFFPLKGEGGGIAASLLRAIVDETSTRPTSRKILPTTESLKSLLSFLTMRNALSPHEKEWYTDPQPTQQVHVLLGCTLSPLQHKLQTHTKRPILTAHPFSHPATPPRANKKKRDEELASRRRTPQDRSETK